MASREASGADLPHMVAGGKSSECGTYSYQISYIYIYINHIIPIIIIVIIIYIYIYMANDLENLQRMYTDCIPLYWEICSWLP